MKTKTKIKDANQLIGMIVGETPESLTDSQLQNIATSLGYRTAQVRLPNYMYDCMYDVSRLQIHVDEQNKITSVRPG